MPGVVAPHLAPSPARPEPLSALALLGLNLLVALVYTVLGVVALKLVIPPHYAAPVFPAAGLALAALLRWGPRLLPAVLLGSFLVNVVLAHEREHFSLLGPALIGLGAALQAAVGLVLVQRWVGRGPLLLTEPRELLRFFAAGAGVACLLSPCVGVGSLWLLDAIPQAQLLPHWLAWWAGDTMGVLLATPVALSLIGRPRSVWAPRRLGVALPMLLASLLLSLATLYVAQTEESRRLHALALGQTELEGSITLPFALSGLLCTALLGMLLLTITGRAARVAQLVTERTEKLRASEERFRSIVEHAPVGVVVTDLRARPQEVNPCFCELLGYTADALKEHSILAITHPDDRAEDDRLGRALLAGEMDRYSRLKRYVDAQGRVRPVRATVSLLRDAKGRPHRLLGIVEDMEEALRLQQVERAHEAAQAANRAQNEFLSRMSHELRTPLNAMLGFAQLLEIDRQPALHPRQQEWVGQIQQAGWHLLAMINDTLDLSRLDVGQLRVQIGPQDLAALVRDSLALVDAQRQRRHVRIHLDLAPDALAVQADPTRLKQVLSNLLSNAIKYNREGGEVWLQARRLEPVPGSASESASGEAPAPARIEVRITDTGPGLSEAEQAQLFQPFNRLGKEHSGIEGTGIGLVIALRLLELMDGRLGVDSPPGKGAVFYFTLPVASDSQ